MDKDEKKFMRKAIRISVNNVEKQKGGPFGAIVVKDGKIIARGSNQVTATNDPTAHAEVVAIRKACKALKTFQLTGCEIYTSCEPCPMCLGAAVMADIPHIVFASHDEVVHSREIVAANPYVRRHIRSYYGGVLEAEAQALVGRFRPDLLNYVIKG